MQGKSFILRSTGAGLIVFLRETHTAPLAPRKTTTMKITAKTWTYEQYLAAVLTQSVAATVVEHDLADGHELGRNDGLDDWLDQSERTTWDEDLAMQGERPEEWRGHHQRALAELVDAIEAKTATEAIATNETLTLKDLAESIAMDHVADPLVGRSVAADDADDFECLVLKRALQEWGFATSELDADALREELRAALGREAAASEDAEDDADDDDDEAHDEDEENAEDAAYSLARFVEAQAYAAYLASGTGPKAPAAYDAFIAAQAATEAARIVRRDAKLRGAL